MYVEFVAIQIKFLQVYWTYVKKKQRSMAGKGPAQTVFLPIGTGSYLVIEIRKKIC